VIALSGGFTDLFGDIENLDDGIIVTSSGGTTTFYDDVVHNGIEIRTSASSITTFFGASTGSGPFTGPGDVFMEGDLRPGNSPAAITFEGNLNLGSLATTEIEIGGIAAGSEHDQLLVGGDVAIAGTLSVVEINGFEIESDQQFTIMEVDGLSAGTFSGLAEGDIVGNFNGHDLFITYTGGDGNDVALYTSVQVNPTAFNRLRGAFVSGDLSDVQESDDSYLKYNPGLTLDSSEAPVWIEFEGTLPTDSPTSLSVTLEASANTPNLSQTIEAFNWLTGQYEEVGVQSASSPADSVFTVDLTADIGKYVESGTGAVKTRTGWRTTGGLILLSPWTICIDQVVWTVTQ
jgi:hypothetical protein